MSFNDIRRSFQ